jgi:transposase/IS5 family transposase
MSGHFLQSDHDAPMLLSPNMQDWLPAKHLARFVVGAVEQLDLRKVEASYEGRGLQAYRPKMLLALLIYGYAVGTYSSRKIERGTIDSIAFRYIAANTSPDHDTIADFRLRVLPELPKLFLQVLLLAKELGFLKVGQVSIDGTKIKANASKHHALSYKHIGKTQAHLRREIKRLMKLSEQTEYEKIDDGLDIPAEIARRETLTENLSIAKSKIEEREAARHAEVRAKHAQRLADRKAFQKRTGNKPPGFPPKLPKLRVEPTAQINLTDEESRIMPSADGFVQGYNAQAAVDTESMLIVAPWVTQATNDKQQIAPALTAIAEVSENVDQVTHLLADAGYFSARNVEACEAALIVPYISMARDKHYSWLAEELAKPEALPDDASATDRMRIRLHSKEGREVYSKRKCTVEPAFGIIKSAQQFRAFLLRSLERVSGEWTLVCMAHNFKRLGSMAGT